MTLSYFFIEKFLSEMRKNLLLKNYLNLIWQFITLVQGIVFEVLLTVSLTTLAAQFLINKNSIQRINKSMDISFYLLLLWIA